MGEGWKGRRREAMRAVCRGMIGEGWEGRRREGWAVRRVCRGMMGRGGRGGEERDGQ